MTKAERAKLRRALDCLMADPDGGSGDFSQGIGLICELLGMRYPAWHDTQNLRAMPLHEIPRGPGRFPGTPSDSLPSDPREPT